MKVAHINWELGFGGIETMLVNIANAQAEQGADIHVIIINDRYESSIIKAFNKNVTLHFIRRKIGSKGLGFVFRLNKLLLTLKPDVIHLHNSRFYSFLLYPKLRNIVVSTLHALPCGKIRGSFLSNLFPLLELLNENTNTSRIDKVPKVVAISNSVRDMLLDKYKVNSITINNGILTSSFKRREPKEFTSPMKIVQVSRLLHSAKGQDLLIQAASKLHGKIHVTFIGDGPSHDYLKKITAEHNAEEWISFAGKQEQSYIAEHLKDYDLYVQPSRNEGFGLTVAEAMAANIPVLVASDQGPAEVTEGDRFGWVFENDNVDDLVRNIEYIRTNYDAALAKSTLATQHVIECYDVSVTARKYLDFYKN